MKITIISAVWCNACLVMKKIYKELENEYNDIEFVKYDYDIDEEEVEKLNVGDILPVIILDNGKEERLVGEKTKEEIENKIKEMVS